jgi:mono/diheme cytochrome c family protein
MKYFTVLMCFVMIACLFFSFQQAPDLKASMARGKDIYSTQCQSCHMEAGEGLEDVYPPFTKSDYLMADKARSIRVVMFGAFEEMKVNGKVYNSEMANLELNDQQISDVLNYVRNSFGNKGEVVTVEEVKALRKK